MASNSSINKLLFLFISSLSVIGLAIAGDPDILTDFIAPATETVDSNFFTYTGMRVLVGSDQSPAFKVLKASMSEFPALNGQSVSYAVLEFPVGGTNPPHSHPRASELLFLFQGLVHFQYNVDPKSPALAVSAFGSANPGTVSAPNNVFTTGIDDNILAQSLKTDVATIQKIKAGLAPKP
ncbi:hypothetical protein LguiA_021353 [Lonicera macranthoides]